MNVQKLIDTLTFYDTHLMQQGYEPVETVDKNVKHAGTSGNHLRWMCREMVTNLWSMNNPAERIEKGMRWLGFIQGVLVMQGDFTLDQVKEHSRSYGPTGASGEQA